MRNLGDTFAPVHWGYLLITETALSQIALEQVIWMATRFKHHLEIVQRAIADHPDFTISIGAANCSEPSYAIEILNDLQAVYPNPYWYWSVGLDAFQTLPRWYRRQELAAECDWLVAPRLALVAPADSTAQIQFCEQVPQKLAAGINIRCQILQMPQVGVSSTGLTQG